ncbi:MAG: DUF4080 domain-containing protein [Treponema sp.]|nr:DUF4080 domain-containing protein [Treponema sp.]
MSDILLVAVNSSFSHTNIAVRYLKYYADRFLCSTCTTQGGCDSDIPKGECDKAAVPAGNFDSGPMQGDLSGGAASPIQFCEFTINQPLGEIIRGINSQNPKIILFSTYIWNIETVVRIAKNIKVLRPEIVVAAGGPEAGFRGSDFLKENPDFDFVMKGEGEETFRQVVEREKASAVPVPQGDLCFVSGAQQCGMTPQGEFVLGAQQCAVPQGNALSAQQCAGPVPQGDLDGVLTAQHSAAAPAGDLGFVPGTQQCGIPQGNALSAQQCSTSQGDSDLSHGAAPAGDLGFVPGTQQCGIPQGNALSAQQCAVPQGNALSAQQYAAAPQGDFVPGAQQCGVVPQGDWDNALSAQQCSTSQGDSDLSHGAVPQGNALSAQQCAAAPAGDLGFVSGAQQCAAPQGNAPSAQQCGVPQGNALSAQQCGVALQGEKFLESLKNVKGLYLRNPSHKNDITFTGDQELICDMGTIPFPYPNLEKMDVDHKIFYYESSRGCPFSCAYCMSSLDTKVRFVPLEKVYADLQRFLDAGVKLVKFVDRTYNLKSERYVGIWKYIMEHHNGKTMFHFEIEGEFLSEEAMEFLQTVPEGIMQFEIGVQSSNPVVLKACGRSPEIKTLRENILRIPKTIHTHLDLIAGLPYEDLESLGRSFDFVMSMEPDALQLGFLKVLYGAPVNSFCGSEPDWKWMKTPPYEILETPYLSYDEILFLKDLETALDAYWNDHHFDTVMRYLAFSYSGSCHNDMGAASQTGDKRAAPQGNALGPQQCAATLKGDSVLSQCAATPAGALDNAPGAQQCAIPQGNALSAQHCGTSQGDSDLSHGAAWWKLFVSLTKWLRTKDAFASAHQKDYWAQMLHEYLEWQEDIAHHGGFVLSAQQCAAVPQGDLDGVLTAQQSGTTALASDFDSGALDAAPGEQQCATAPAGALDNAPGAQQCGIPQGDFDSGALDNALSSSQCNVARELLRFDYIAGGKKTNPPAWLRRNYDDQGHYDALQRTTGIRHSRLDFVYSDFDTFSVNPLDPATWHSAPAAPWSDLDKAPSEQQCGTPQSDQDNVERSQQGATYSVLFLYARKESDHPTDFQRVPHQILIH